MAILGLSMPLLPADGCVEDVGWRPYLVHLELRARKLGRQVGRGVADGGGILRIAHSAFLLLIRPDII